MTTSPIVKPFEQFHETVSSEAFTPKALKDALTAAGKAVSGLVRWTFEWDHTRPTVLNAPRVANALKKTTYLDMADVTVQVPVGFTSEKNLLAYVEHIQRTHLPLLKDEVDQAIKYATQEVSRYLSDADARTERTLGSDSVTAEKKATALAVAAQQAMKQDATYFVAQRHNNTLTFDQAFYSLAEYNNTVVGVNQINTVRWKAARPTDIQKKVKGLSHLSNALFKDIESHHATPSPAVLSHISKLLSNAAVMVEYYSAMTTQITDLTEAMLINERKILRML